MLQCAMPVSRKKWKSEQRDHLPQPFPQQGPWDILHLPSGWDYHGDCRTGAGRNVKCKGDCIEPHAF